MTINKINKLKAYAEANYERGMDSFVECYNDEEWAEFLASNNNSVSAAKADMRETALIQLEKKANAINSAF